MGDLSVQSSHYSLHILKFPTVSMGNPYVPRLVEVRQSSRRAYATTRGDLKVCLEHGNFPFYLASYNAPIKTLL